MKSDKNGISFGGVPITKMFIDLNQYLYRMYLFYNNSVSRPACMSVMTMATLYKPSIAPPD
jgi:hypothetical protein